MTRLTLILGLLLLPAALFADDHFQEQIDKLVERVEDLEEERAEDKQEIAELQEENAELKQKVAEGEKKDEEQDQEIQQGQDHDQSQDLQAEITDTGGIFGPIGAAISQIIKDIIAPREPYYKDDYWAGEEEEEEEEEEGFPPTPTLMPIKNPISPLEPISPPAPEPEPAPES